ncbi:hypothetical protein DESAMIL20_671 [Desulfurella amilsii]|uniref:Uncharacterized protein n=1 Tax=Desulfurella amilsii TaxID=1562698 RepID=A0A1X4XY76_9BACT|nr:hypothetical protein [Desulfurella amilsii]OSS42487.1 hypothetical protein DESAMIL20_671 [Desulfurella amilsii]
MLKKLLSQVSQTGLFGGFMFEEIRENSELIGVKVRLVRRDWDMPFKISIFLNELPDIQKVNRKTYALRKIALMQALSLVFWDIIDIDSIQRTKKYAV